MDSGVNASRREVKETLLQILCDCRRDESSRIVFTTSTRCLYWRWKCGKEAFWVYIRATWMQLATICWGFITSKSSWFDVNWRRTRPGFSDRWGCSTGYREFATLCHDVPGALRTLNWRMRTGSASYHISKIAMCRGRRRSKRQGNKGKQWNFGHMGCMISKLRSRRRARMCFHLSLCPEKRLEPLWHHKG